MLNYVKFVPPAVHWDVIQTKYNQSDPLGDFAHLIEIHL